ncbi:MAG TPA: DUF2892 domain-containing protein [Chthoniobacterales bacterium]|nr:DUF2892 domain-containing protein [Chthoniobacterales bacterium]
MKQNIESRGRLARAGLGIIALLAAACLVPQNKWLAAIFLGVGLFTLFEAARGWCAVRACGIKTPF